MKKILRGRERMRMISISLVSALKKYEEGSFLSIFSLQGPISCSIYVASRS